MSELDAGGFGDMLCGLAAEKLASLQLSNENGMDQEQDSGEQEIGQGDFGLPPPGFAPLDLGGGFPAGFGGGPGMPGGKKQRGSPGAGGSPGDPFAGGALMSDDQEQLVDGGMFNMGNIIAEDVP